MPDNTVTNWFGDVISHPRVIVDVHSVDDIVSVFRDPAKYPSPVRAVGSNHSTSPCGVAEGGTLLRMRMNRILEIGYDTLTVEAGATHLAMARQLEAAKKQFYVNTEIGSLTAGSASIAGTKDSSMPGEFGQVGSYIIGVKMVRPDGSLLEVTEASDPALMRQVRSSYGMFGIVYEVTYRIRALTPLAVHHKTFELEEFIGALPDLKALNESMMSIFFRSRTKSRSSSVNTTPVQPASRTGLPGLCAITPGGLQDPSSAMTWNKRSIIPRSATASWTSSMLRGGFSLRTWW